MEASSSSAMSLNLEPQNPRLGCCWACESMMLQCYCFRMFRHRHSNRKFCRLSQRQKASRSENLVCSHVFLTSTLFMSDVSAAGCSVCWLLTQRCKFCKIHIASMHQRGASEGIASLMPRIECSSSILSSDWPLFWQSWQPIRHACLTLPTGFA